MKLIFATLLSVFVAFPAFAQVVENPSGPTSDVVMPGVDPSADCNCRYTTQGTLLTAIDNPIRPSGPAASAPSQAPSSSNGSAE